MSTGMHGDLASNDAFRHTLDSKFDRMRQAGRIEGILGCANWLRLQGLHAQADAMVQSMHSRVSNEGRKS